ncbi:MULTISPECIES: hypothetical protein [Halomonas]|uniref:Uncharacterized protein n=2 Tax=Halomonas halophila TaxID=29573 RepID=A0ABQ0U8C2_9GAMM|nr:MULTISPECIES: hypothetical protein [Halomonas]MDR5890581.1 hypothetical protein [Halomonas salina]WJY08223.1 hypothetical protein QWG60_04745 [Halomonas halophila]GEK74660.1 hypothetical protein HHA04nite_32040 [Halomonas halophila]
MGMEDRDYYWEDRKRRENKFDKKDTYYRPKEFRKKSSQTYGRYPDDWKVLGGITRKKYMIFSSFFLGCFLTFWAVMAVLNINADLLYFPYEATRKIISALGFL